MRNGRLCSKLYPRTIRLKKFAVKQSPSAEAVRYRERIETKILENIYEYSKSKVEMLFHTEVTDVETLDGGFTVITNKGERYSCKHLVLAAGRSGSKWLSETCEKLGLHLTRNRVDIGVRVELPAVIFTILRIRFTRASCI